MSEPISTLNKRRRLLQAGVTLLTFAVTPQGHAASEARILAVRVWPANDYTRITLEGAETLKYNWQIVKNPERLVVDLEGVEFNSVLQSLPTKIIESDPYIRLIRAGRNRPGVVRIVVELKAEVKPQLFTLNPIGNYGYRLVLDLYPTVESDPLLTLIQKNGTENTATGPVTAATPSTNTPPVTTNTEPTKNTPAATVPSTASVTPPPPPSANPPMAKAEPEPTTPPQAPVISGRGESKSGKRPIIIALDPGHGGEDPGAVGQAGTYEKNVTLAIARRLKARIEREAGMRVLLTRDADYFVPLGQRVQKARRVQADLFVSIHADAFIKPEARGSSVFILSERGASSSAAKWLANHENASDSIGGINVATHDAHLARTLLDLSQTATLNDSTKLAKAVLNELGGINTLHRGAIEEAGFAVLKAPDIPSILIETAFISNPEEERRLNDDAYQDKMAEAILRGMKRYLAKSASVSRSKVAML